MTRWTTAITVTAESHPEHTSRGGHPDSTEGASTDPPPRSHGFSRRRLIASATAAGSTGVVGAVAGFGVGRSGAANHAEAAPSRDLSGANGPVTEPFYGSHQSGVETPPQAYGHFLALSLKPGTEAVDVMRWLRLITADAAALTQGDGPLADSEPELAHDPARLTVTFGFGPGLVKLAGGNSVPTWLGPLEKFPIDELEPDRCTGDLLLQICGDDRLTLAHARRMLFKDSRTFAEVAWQRVGFRRAYGSQGEGKTQRNLFGQLDGTANPGPGSEDFARIIWGQGTGRADALHSARGTPPDNLGAHLPDWMDGGTTLVLRDIAMNLDTWDKADRPAREFATGRALDSGAPLSGTDEFDVPDFAAVDKRGLTKISAASHVARARDGLDPEVQIHRRTFNYETGAGEKAGLLFASFQADIVRQFLPIQRRLAEVDLLNEWTTPIASTVWAIPPGIKEGDYIGQSLFEG